MLELQTGMWDRLKLVGGGVVVVVVVVVGGGGGGGGGGAGFRGCSDRGNAGGGGCFLACGEKVCGWREKVCGGAGKFVGVQEVYGGSGRKFVESKGGL